MTTAITCIQTAIIYKTLFWVLEDLETDISAETHILQQYKIGEKVQVVFYLNHPLISTSEFINTPCPNTVSFAVS